MAVCANCDSPINRSGNRYCSNQCQRDLEYATYISSWKESKVSGDRGVNTKNISAHLKRYLLNKYENRCSVCGWNEINPTTGNIPLEIDHIDGNPDNNTEDNLRILCPNCHSLTPSYRNLNKGMGRQWRRLKYIKT